MDATQPAETESRLKRLIALRASQEAALAEGIHARELSALSKEYRATLAEIDELTPQEAVGDSIDEIAARRAARRAAPAKGSGRTKRTS